MATLIGAHRGPWTSDDLDAFPEGWKVEILDGTLIVNAQPNPFHQLVADRLRTVLDDQLGDELPAVRDIGLALSPTEFAPDVTVLRRDHVSWRTKAQSPAAAVLVVEVASPSTSAMDRHVKTLKYAEAGIPGYWRVEIDPVVTVVAHALRDGTYVELGSWIEGETVAVDDPVTTRFDPAALRP